MGELFHKQRTVKVLVYSQCQIAGFFPLQLPLYLPPLIVAEADDPIYGNK